MNKVEEFFDRLADTWINDNDYHKLNMLIDKLDIKEGYDILDIGCGKGVITPLLYDRSKRLVDAVDLSSNMINAAKKMHNDNSKYNFMALDFLEYKPEKSYDLAIIFNAYPHFLDVDKVVLKANEILKRNGKFVIMHDFSKELLNTHHQAEAMGVSRMLEDAEAEANKYAKYFNIKVSEDNKDHYLLILEKK